MVESMCCGRIRLGVIVILRSSDSLPEELQVGSGLEDLHCTELVSDSSVDESTSRFDEGLGNLAAHGAVEVVIVAPRDSLANIH